MNEIARLAGMLKPYVFGWIQDALTKGGKSIFAPRHHYADSFHHSGGVGNYLRFTSGESSAPSNPGEILLYRDVNTETIIAQTEFGIADRIFNDQIVSFPIQSAYFSGASLSLLNAYNLAINFRDAQTDYALWNYRLPTILMGGTARMIIRWLTTTASPTGSIKWNGEITRKQTGETYRTTATDSGTVTTAVGAQNTWMQSTIDLAMAEADYSNGDFMDVKLIRDGTNGADTHTSTVYVGGIVIFLYVR